MKPNTGASAISQHDPLGDEYETPLEVVKAIERRLFKPGYGFTLDAAARACNTKCAKYYSLDEGTDGLKELWTRESVFTNPPYSRGSMIHWVDKNIKGSGANMAALYCRADVATKWFQKGLLHATCTLFLSPRVKHIHPVTGLADRPSIGSAVFVFTYVKTNWEACGLKTPLPMQGGLRWKV